MVLLTGCLGGAYELRGKVRVQRRNRACGFAVEIRCRVTRQLVMSF